MNKLRFYHTNLWSRGSTLVIRTQLISLPSVLATQTWFFHELVTGSWIFVASSPAERVSFLQAAWKNSQVWLTLTQIKVTCLPLNQSLGPEECYYLIKPSKHMRMESTPPRLPLTVDMGEVSYPWRKTKQLSRWRKQKDIHHTLASFWKWKYAGTLACMVGLGKGRRRFPQIFGGFHWENMWVILIQTS